MNNHLSQKFTPLSLLKFTLPTIVMMVFMALYQMVDAIFVSNFIGENALSSINIVYPVPSIIVAVSIMLATGGSAVIATQMGEGKKLEAKQNFSLIILVGILFGIVVLLIGVFFTKPLIQLLGATPILYDYCYEYLYTLLLFTPLAVLQMLFQNFFVTCGKPQIGLCATIAGGLANILFDYIFMVVLNMGVTGAALGTAIGYFIPAIFGLLYFTFKRNGPLYFIKPHLNLKILKTICFNGSSEMVTNLSNAITTLFFNYIMLKYLGENGVAAITIVLYTQFLLCAVYLGFSIGVAPIFSYNYGNENMPELKKVFKISCYFIVINSFIVFICSMAFSTSIISIFVDPLSEVFALTKTGFKLFSINFLFIGLNIFASALFTSFSNGKVSAIISFLRTFVFLILSIIFLPMILGVNGIWLSIPLSEILTLIISLIFIYKLKDTYHYL